MKIYFKNLRTTEDFEQILPFFSMNDLFYFEKEIENYENSTESLSERDYSTIIKWWEGLIDTMSLIHDYEDYFDEFVIYPSFNENLSGDNMYELRICYPRRFNKTDDFPDKLYYGKDGFCKEFKTIDEAFQWIEKNIK